MGYNQENPFLNLQRVMNKSPRAVEKLEQLGYKYHNGEWVTLSEYLSKNDTVKQVEGYVIAARDLNLSNGKELTKGKSYKILVETADWYKVINDLGKEVSYLKTFFNKKSEGVKSLQTQSSQDEEESIPEWMEGFEDLVYSGYNLIDGDYLVLSKLSVEQIKFLKHRVKTYNQISFDVPHTMVVFKAGYGFLGCVKTYWRKKEIFFNDLFIPKP